MNNISFQMKGNIFHYRTDTLYNQKHAVCFMKSTSLQCPLCQQADSALHILSGCQHQVVSNMIIEKHNVACRLIMKAISKGTLGACIVSLDIGSESRLSQQNLQIPDHASNRFVPQWLFQRNLPDRERRNSSPPDAVLITPSLCNKATPYATSDMLRVLRSGTVCNQLERITMASPVASPKDINVKERHIHLVEIKYCEDTRPGYHLEASQLQN